MLSVAIRAEISNVKVQSCIWRPYCTCFFKATKLYLRQETDQTFEALADEAQKNAVPNQWFEVPARKVYCRNGGSRQ